MALAPYRKAIVAVVGAFVAILATQGIDVDPEVSTSVITVATAVLVYFVRNETVK